MIPIVLNLYEDSSAFPDEAYETQRILYLSDDTPEAERTEAKIDDLLRRVNDLYWDVDDAVAYDRKDHPLYSLYDDDWETVGWEGRIDLCLETVARKVFATHLVGILKPVSSTMQVG